MKLVHLLCVATALMSTGLARADQPNMQATLRNLAQAKSYLERATADKGGHRAHAKQLIEQAMAEVKAGMEYDRTHANDPGRK